MEEHTLKVIVIGNSGVGKTCLIQRYITGEYSQVTMATVATGFHAKTLRMGKYTVKLQLWDTAGQERFASLGKIFFRNAHACIFVFDLCDLASLTALKDWKRQFIEAGKYTDEAKLPMFLVGNKNDKKQAKKTTDRDIELFINGEDISYFSVSASRGNGIIELFQLVLEKALTFEIEEQKKKDAAVIKLPHNLHDYVIEDKRSCCG